MTVLVHGNVSEEVGGMAGVEPIIITLRSRQLAGWIASKMRSLVDLSQYQTVTHQDHSCCLPVGGVHFSLRCDLMSFISG